MDVLQQDLASTKTVIGDRLQAAEESMAALQTSHRTLADELLARQQTLREEIQANLHAKESAWNTEPRTHLQATSPEFIPSSDSCPPTGSAGDPGPGLHDNGANHSAVTQPSPYDGRSNWEAYQGFTVHSIYIIPQAVRCCCFRMGMCPIPLLN